MRAWIVGNGPSLNETPLELLSGEVTFACNRIHLLYPRTTWRPTFYVRGEIDDKDWRDVAVYHAERMPCYFSPSIARTVKAVGGYDSHEVYKECGHMKSNYFRGNRPEAWHLPDYCCYASVVNLMCQIAKVEGYAPIYLVGCDLGTDHFDPDYGYSNEMPEAEMKRTQIHMHEIINREAEVYNATVGGELEVYERVDMREVL